MELLRTSTNIGLGVGVKPVDGSICLVGLPELGTNGPAGANNAATTIYNTACKKEK